MAVSRNIPSFTFTLFTEEVITHKQIIHIYIFSYTIQSLVYAIK